MDAAHGLADPALVRLVAYEAPERFHELLDAGFPFRTNELQACFGKGMVGAVIDQPELARHFRLEITRRPIQLLERTMAFRLLIDDNRCTGAVCLNGSGHLVVISARSTILSTGGASTIFRYNFAGPELTGDGHSIAIEAGCALANLEFYQSIPGITSPVPIFFPQWFLAGKPKLFNALGEQFLAESLAEDSDADDLMYQRSLHGPFTSSLSSGRVDIAMAEEILAGRGSASFNDPNELAGVYCDFAGLPSDTREDLDTSVGRPAIGWLRSRGVDVEAGPVPIAPFAHAFNGGIVTDEHARTAVPGLYACGEVAAGPHGANRIGGHMMAVLLVLGHRAGQHGAVEALGLPQPPVSERQIASALSLLGPLSKGDGGAGPAVTRKAIQQAMSPIMITKDERTLNEALSQLNQIGETTLRSMTAGSPAELFMALGTRSLHEMALLVARSALLRQESRGPHFRKDCPEEITGGLWNRILRWQSSAGVPTPTWGQPVGKADSAHGRRQ